MRPALPTQAHRPIGDDARRQDQSQCEFGRTLHRDDAGQRVQEFPSLANYGDIFGNVAGILAIEWLSSAQGMDFRRPLKSTEAVEKAWQLLRWDVPFYDKDRYFAPDIERATALIESGQLAALLDAQLLGF